VWPSRVCGQGQLNNIFTRASVRPKSRTCLFPFSGHLSVPKRLRTLCVLFFLAGDLLWAPANILARQPGSNDAMPAVLHSEGLIHGFLALRTLDGELLADGDIMQEVRGDRVTSRLVFHFKDTSVHEETVVFSQRRTFRVLRYHLLQKGPAFKHAIEVSLDGISGQLSVYYSEDDGKEKSLSEHLQLPSNIANGILSILLKNIRPTDLQTTFSMVAATPKPRIVKLAVSPEGEEWFTVGNSRHKTTRYLVKIQIGGVAGLVAPVVGKQPEDTRIWIATENSPTVVKSEGPLYPEGPIWRIELITPVWKDR